MFVYEAAHQSEGLCIIVTMLTIILLSPGGLALHFFLSLFFALYASTVAGQTRPSYHITPQMKWMNDPQRPFRLGDEWHLYYLYNSDFNISNPGAGGTEWYRIMSTDMVQWTDQGLDPEV